MFETAKKNFPQVMNKKFFIQQKVLIFVALRYFFVFKK